jgi:hypothetical protein
MSAADRRKHAVEAVRGQIEQRLTERRFDLAANVLHGIWDGSAVVMIPLSTKPKIQIALLPVIGSLDSFAQSVHPEGKASDVHRALQDVVQADMQRSTPAPEPHDQIQTRDMEIAMVVAVLQWPALLPELSQIVNIRREVVHGPLRLLLQEIGVQLVSGSIDAEALIASVDDADLQRLLREGLSARSDLEKTRRHLKSVADRFLREIRKRKPLAGTGGSSLH